MRRLTERMKKRLYPPASFACAAIVALWTGVAGCGGGAPLASTPTVPVPTPTPSPDPTPTPTPTPSPTPTPVVGLPAPIPTPEACPTLTRWHSVVHNVTDALHREAQEPTVGGHVVVDSTPLFMGRSCNAEHNFCDGRKCEDPRGGEWSLLAGGSPVEVRGDGYQLRIGPLRAGLHRWRVCPRSDAIDTEGMPVPLGPDPCTQGEFTVLAPPE
jgi:hypothetical protein